MFDTCHFAHHSNLALEVFASCVAFALSTSFLGRLWRLFFANYRGHFVPLNVKFTFITKRVELTICSYRRSLVADHT